MRGADFGQFKRWCGHNDIVLAERNPLAFVRHCTRTIRDIQEQVFTFAWCFDQGTSC